MIASTLQKRLFLILFVIAGSLSGYQVVDNGVVVELPDAGQTIRLLQVQVIDEEIIRVVAAPKTGFSARASLIVEKTSWPPTAHQISQQGEIIELSTAALKVKISEKTGQIGFYDAHGRPILLEEKNGGKTMMPAVVMDEPTFHIEQRFSSPLGEAFYGLGQHQYDWMNYRGKDLDLYQINIIAAVPFLVSNRHYGILWDNNSRSKFGDPADFLPLSSLKLYDEQQTPGGLRVDYFQDSELKTLLLTQKESVIAHDNLEVWDNYPSGFDKNRGSIRWSGFIECERSGYYNFRFYSSHYAKFWFDDELKVDSWRVNWMPWARIVRVKLQAGRRYPIKIEWTPNGGYLGLTAKRPEKESYQNSLSLYSEVADQIDYYFIHGSTLDQVIAGYRNLTGQAPMMPKWAMGLWQCRQRYQSQEELINVVKEFRQRDIPLDNIVQDWFYWPEDKWGDHDFDAQRFPDPAGMVEQLHHELNTHIMISVWPKFYVGTHNYAAFQEQGWLYPRNVEKQERDWVGRGYVSTFYDPYSEGARDLFWRQINEKLFAKGFDAWWLDATEPDIHSNLEHLEWRKRIGPTALGSSSRYLNTYSLMNAKGIYEGQRKTNPDQRVFILTRSAYAGQQRYAAATWSGDIAARWYDMKAQISAGLNFALSGIPYWAMDIGGFSTESRYQNAEGETLEEWREQMTRWFQFGAFCPLFRVHGEYPYREMYHVAPPEHPAYQAMLNYDRLRYRLMPYIYTLAGMVTHQDYTIMRALVMDFNDDRQVMNIGDQYMFGPALLVCPVTTYKARSREVYLPQGVDWYDWHTGECLRGGKRIQADAPYADIPLYVRCGSILPIGPEINYTEEKPADPIRLYVFTGADGEFMLYEDENINYDYEKGEFSEIPFQYDDHAKTLTIGQRRGAFDGMLKNRTFEIKWMIKGRTRGVDFSSTPDQVIQYDGSAHKVRMEQ